MQVAIQALGGKTQLAQAMLESLGDGIDITPVQAEVQSETAHADVFLAFGKVVKCWDKEHAGRIDVQSTAFPDGPITCDYVSPVGGAGYGFFAVPGIGATVLFGKAPFADPPVRYFWFGCLYAAGQQDSPTLKTHPYIQGQPEQIARNEVLDDGSAPDETPIVSHGIPNERSVYQDNNLPDSFVLKHPAGHSISLTDKTTGERDIDEIKLKTAENKRVILSDAPPGDGGECIHLIDENSNQIKITSLGDNPDSIVTEAGKNIEVTTHGGKIDHMIGPNSDGDYEIDVVGSGDFKANIHNGNLEATALKSITLRCVDAEGTGSVLTMTQDDVTIKANKVNIVAAGGDVSIKGISHTDHVHVGNLGAPTSPPR